MQTRWSSLPRHQIDGETLPTKTRSEDIRPVYFSTDNSRSEEDHSRTLDSLLQRKRQIPRLVNRQPSWLPNRLQQQRRAENRIRATFDVWGGDHQHGRQLDRISCWVRVCSQSASELEELVSKKQPDIRRPRAQLFEAAASERVDLDKQPYLLQLLTQHSWRRGSISTTSDANLAHSEDA